MCLWYIQGDISLFRQLEVDLVISMERVTVLVSRVCWHVGLYLHGNECRKKMCMVWRGKSCMVRWICGLWCRCGIESAVRICTAFALILFSDSNPFSSLTMFSISQAAENPLFSSFNSSSCSVPEWADWPHGQRFASELEGPGSSPEITNFLNNICGQATINALTCPCSPSSVNWFKQLVSTGWEWDTAQSTQPHPREHLVASICNPDI